MTNPDSGEGVLFRRMASKDDLKFVLKSWLRDYSHPRNPWAGSIERERHMRALKDTIMALFECEDVYVTMACNEEDPDQIFGFVCYQEGHKVNGQEVPVLHYVYVKALLRNNKIGSDLVAIARGRLKGVMRYTFKTPACRRFLPGANFNPNIVRRIRKQEKKTDG
jgi:hypothetical protein